MNIEIKQCQQQTYQLTKNGKNEQKKQIFIKIQNDVSYLTYNSNSLPIFLEQKFFFSNSVFTE